MNLLVTGGAGFIGANFINYMLEKYPDYRIVCIDALTYAADLKNLKKAFQKNNFRFVQGDICNKKLLSSLFSQEDFTAVVNFAAESHVDRSIENPRIFLETNVWGTMNLLECCKEYGNIRFHQVSTDEVYGDLPLEGGEPFKETDTLRPSSPYSASKASADLLALSFMRTFGVPVTVSRSGNNYGPFQHSEKLIPLMIKKALKGESLPLYGNGLNCRDWIYVSDHCRAIDLIIHKGTAGEIYNVGSGKEKSNLEVVKEILFLTGANRSLISFVPDRPGHDLRYSLNTEKIEKELSFRAQTDFSQGLESTVEWYKKKYLSEG